MGDHHIDGTAYFGSAGTQRRIGARRDVRPQTAALLDMLAVLQSTLSQANRAGDLAGAREAVAGRVACWVALADLADEVHPAYAMACRRLAWIEGESLPPAEPRDLSVPARGAFAGRTAIARQMALEGRHSAAGRTAVAARHLATTRAQVPATETAPRHLAPGRVDTAAMGAPVGRHSTERAAVRRLAIAVPDGWPATPDVRAVVPDPRSPVQDVRPGVPDVRPPAARPAGWHPVPRPRQSEDHRASVWTRAAG
jgi:hypothetical protein